MGLLGLLGHGDMGWGSVLMGLLGLLGHGDMGWESVVMGLLGLLGHGLGVSTDGPSRPFGTVPTLI